MIQIQTGRLAVVPALSIYASPVLLVGVELTVLVGFTVIVKAASARTEAAAWSC